MDPRDYVELPEEVNALFSRLRLLPAFEAIRCFIHRPLQDDVV